MDETPPDKIILDIQDTRRYFESQTGGLDLLNFNEEDTRQLLRGYQRKFEGWQPEMAKQVMQSRSADKVCMELTNTIKRKIRHDDKSATGNSIKAIEEACHLRFCFQTSSYRLQFSKRFKAIIR